MCLSMGHLHHSISKAAVPSSFPMSISDLNSATHHILPGCLQDFLITCTYIYIYHICIYIYIYHREREGNLVFVARSLMPSSESWLAIPPCVGPQGSLDMVMKGPQG